MKRAARATLEGREVGVTGRPKKRKPGAPAVAMRLSRVHALLICTWRLADAHASNRSWPKKHAHHDDAKTGQNACVLHQSSALLKAASKGHVMCRR